MAARGLGFGLRWAAGADAGGGVEMETKTRFGLEGVAAPGPEFWGGQGAVPGWGLEVGECRGSLILRAEIPAVSMVNVACQTDSSG